MTSAPNRLLPLSGNKIVWIFVLISVFFNTAACNLFKKQPQDTVREEKKQETGVVVKPEKESPKKETVKKTPRDIRKITEDSLLRIFPSVKKEKYTIVAFLPLHLKNAEREKTQKTAITVSQEFYKGMKMAADTLQKCGMKLNIHVFDSEDPQYSATRVTNILRQNDADLVFAPLLESRMNFLDSISKKLKINLVSPLQTVENCDTSRKYYFESTPNNEAVGLQIAEHLKQQYSGYNFILINQNDLKDNPVAQAFASRFPMDSLHVINFSGRGASLYKPDMKLMDKNVIFIPSKSEVFVSALMSQLRVGPQLPEDENNKQKDIEPVEIPTQEIVVAGLLNWQFFKTIEGDLWEKFKVQLPNQYFIDYTKPEVNLFIENYREKYNEEPGVWAFMGFDELVYYANQLQANGKYFQAGVYMEEKAQPMLHTDYMLKYDEKCGGWKNRNVNISKFEGYEMIKVQR